MFDLSARECDEGSQRADCWFVNHLLKKMSRTRVNFKKPEQGKDGKTSDVSIFVQPMHFYMINKINKDMHSYSVTNSLFRI